MKRLILFAIAAVFVLHLNAIGQVETADGTIVVAEWSKSELVVAADSRECWGPSYSDDKCKIIAFGNKMIFAACGRQDIRNPFNMKVVFDAFAIARQQYVRLTRNSTPEQLPMALAAAWGEAFKKQFERFAALYGPMVVSGLTKNYVAGGLFAEFEKDGTLLLVTENLRYEQNGWNIKITPSRDQTDVTKWSDYVMGRDEILRETQAAKTFQAHQWKIDTARKIQSSPISKRVATTAIVFVELTIDHLPNTKIDANGKPFSEVGRPVAAVQLLPGQGVNWILPGNCKPH
jgi:hypothetical protein